MEFRRDTVMMYPASQVPQKNIQQVKDLIESRQFMRARKMINSLQSSYSSSAYLLALKALLYKMTGFHDGAQSLCEDSKKFLLTDPSVLLEVLSTLQTVCHLLGMNNLATGYYQYACAEVPNNLDLMKGLFYCHHRESSFVNQLEISFRIYDLNKEHMFLFWSVFSIQLQVCCQLLEKHMTDHNINEPETFLVYIYVSERHAAMNDVACEILSKLGATLLVAHVGRGRLIEGLRLVACVSDYIAAEEALSQHLESCPDGRGLIINSMQDPSGPQTSLLACIASRLYKDECSLEMLNVLKRSDLESGRRRCLTAGSQVDKAVNEYFGRHGCNAEVCLQVLTKDEELLLINNLLKDDSLTPNVLRKEFSSILTICDEITGGIISQERRNYYGTSIALKTKEFIILAADGKLTPSDTYDTLGLKADKLKDIDGMCAAVTGAWENLSRTLSTLSRCKKFLEDECKERPTVGEFADFAKKKLFRRLCGVQMILGGFDKSNHDQYVPCISFVDAARSFQVEGSFYCMGSGYKYAMKILREGEVHDGMRLDEAISLVEKALAYASICDVCTGGWASIHVIKDYKTIMTLPREHIRSTLQRRHLSFLAKFRNFPISFS